MVVVEASRPHVTADTVCQPPVESEPPTQVAPPRVAASHTSAESCSIQGVDLVNFLINFEHLVIQEIWARSQMVDHEPAFSFMRRFLDGVDPLPRTLPTARPLRNLPEVYNHVDEPAWVTYEGFESDMDDDALLLNESRDMTEEELAHLLT